ncbi:MAG: hypothetical protein ACREOG_14000, partial [Gemmatimonadaceae bacterium]
VRMRSVRCDQCGTKALLAASQCPHCGHLFEVRDGFGDLLPLAHCATCDSDYPLRQGECRWCGTKPESFRVAPYAWKGAGVLAFLGLVGGAWLANRTSGNDVPPTAELVSRPTASLTTVVDSGIAADALNRTDSAATITAVQTSIAVNDTLSLDSTSMVAPQAPPVIDSPPARSSSIMRVRAPVSSKPVARPRRTTVRWVAATAHQWVTVRAAAAHSARFVASIGPDTRVQLGEARGAWRRIRTKGISGWVERTQF